MHSYSSFPPFLPSSRSPVLLSSSPPLLSSSPVLLSCPHGVMEAQVGRGPTVLQFFYQSPKDDIRIGFTPGKVQVQVQVQVQVRGIQLIGRKRKSRATQGQD